MSERLLTSEARQAGQAALREARRRLADEASASVAALIADTDPLPSWALALARRAKKGNLRALVGLKCADCSGFERHEIRSCAIRSCPLHALRPYRW